MGKTFFITGTDTGVGKTLLTALLLHHLRQTGVHAVAIKPFCSGSRNDAKLFRALQGPEFTIDEINPFYFPEPLAPLLSARKLHRSIKLSEVLDRIETIKQRCECLLIEGVGGVLVPLGKDFSVRDLIRDSAEDVFLVGRNKLGTINHIFLSVLAMQQFKGKRLKVALTDPQKGDASSESNHMFLQESLDPTPVFLIPFLGPRASRRHAVKENCKIMKKVLAQILE